MDIKDEVLKFGKFNGKTWGELSQREDGVSYMQWYINQPCSNPKFAKQDSQKKEQIRQLLERLGRKGHEDEINRSPDHGHLIVVILELQKAVGELSKKIDSLVSGKTDDKWEE